MQGHHFAMFPPLPRPVLWSTGVQATQGRRSGGLETAEAAGPAPRQKIVTQPRKEVCDLGGAGSGARETERVPRGNERREAGMWRCGGGAHYPIGT
jgi:hypothetical protein